MNNSNVKKIDKIFTSIRNYINWLECEYDINQCSNCGKILK